MSSLQERLAEILDDQDLTKASLARAAGVSSASVTYWMSGETKEISARAASNIEKHTGYRAAWIATGVGHKKIAPSEKDDMISSEERELVLAFRDLSHDQQTELLMDVMRSADHNRKIVEEALAKINKAKKIPSTG